MICKYIAQGAIRVGDFKLMFAPKFNKDGWYILHLLSTLIYHQKNIPFGQNSYINTRKYENFPTGTTQMLGQES